MKSWHHPLASRSHVALAGGEQQRGAIAVMFAALLMFICGMFALALDLSMVYNRKAEMQNAANTMALAAARELNGTTAGINEAIRQASLRLTEPHENLTYQYSKLPMEWSNAAIQFSSRPDGDWQDAGAAGASPANLMFARVDTRGLGATYNQVKTLFIHVLAPDSAIVRVGSSAVAGRSSINVTPLAVCALLPEPRKNVAGELVEFGFRRGLSYDLMTLNSGSSSGKNFLVNPFAPPGTAGALPVTDLSVVKPFVCSGTMAMTRVTGGDLTVSPSFPLTSLFDQLNSRFDFYTATTPCDKHTAPPDKNVKEYAFDATDRWMNVLPIGQAALLSSDGTTPSGMTAPKFGPVWSYAPAAHYSASPPAGGESPFATTDWATLYSNAAIKSGKYPTDQTQPYFNTASAYFKKPPSLKIGVSGRRVLNVPLLSCPVSGSRATALGIGKFFMTVKATGTALNAEFAGMAPEASVGGRVELFQ